MGADADPRDASRLGFKHDQVIQEFGWGEDVDDDLRADIEDITGSELVDEYYGDVTDGVIAWYRDGDGDLTDLLVDVQTLVEEGGKIWIFTLKPGRDGHVGHGLIQESSTTAGLHATSTFSIAEDWNATKLAASGRGR
ncbi:hypothetical protein GCM10025865_25610 [Paraoerskovia sediminicola]|uniref:DUF3052 domain-containing protein n=1 Tax=Paraoerskovia sediminicola TaxID=1138587 RepID=A0ABN6XHR8_9CELL|nr:DUF3052 domain-containing protein [Paraoerskovia sediminicola]BDZ43262.1 hypothetical protein GCM10025865_25610 [Paraoerskovia sediminicola]